MRSRKRHNYENDLTNFVVFLIRTRPMISWLSERLSLRLVKSLVWTGTANWKKLNIYFEEKDKNIPQKEPKFFFFFMIKNYFIFKPTDIEWILDNIRTYTFWTFFDLWTNSRELIVRLVFSNIVQAGKPSEAKAILKHKKKFLHFKFLSKDCMQTCKTMFFSVLVPSASWSVMQAFVTDVSCPIQTAKPLDRFIPAIVNIDAKDGPLMTTLSTCNLSIKNYVPLVDGS